MLSSFLLATIAAACCSTAQADRWARVDDQGVLRWQDDRSEVALFGVNYYTPFSADYEGLARLGEDHRVVIDHDVAHFQRLGLDAIRLHVFDRQISDLEGNLLDNENLKLFDYLVFTAKQRGIYTVLTPLAWWHYHSANAGFSSLYSKPEMLRSPAARSAQKNYLRQFMEHVNPYTGMAYRDEPAIVAIELINEPLYDRTTTVDDVRDYIDDLAGAVRAAGARQPIFYNGWAGMEEAVGKSSIEGCTFGWYPTGLVSGGCLRSNYLPAVDDYPRMRMACLAEKAKIVYEFDAADVPGRVMYPAMARAFRSGGAQIATQFQYDPTPLAAFNYGWCTHYLNLIYAPGKTLSFALAAEAFRRTPRLARFGEYPASAAFGPFTLDFDRDMSVMRTDDAYLYANDTDLPPPHPERLERVFGCGSSPVVRYEGTGAYFLDRLGNGQWRLEVYPDAVWIDDPFAPTSLTREVSRVLWAEHPITVRLPDLGDSFQCQRIAPNAAASARAVSGSFSVTPGVYTLARQGATLPTNVAAEFWAPAPEYERPAVWWQTARRWRAGVALPVQVSVAARDVKFVRLHITGGERLAMDHIAPYLYSASVPGERLVDGAVHLQLEVQTPTGAYWFPAGATGQQKPREPFTVFQIDRNTAPHVRGSPACRAEVVSGSTLNVESAGFHGTAAAGLRLPASRPDQSDFDTLIVRGRATQAATDRVELGLVQADGKAYGIDVPLWNEQHDVRVPLVELKPLWATPPGRLDVTRLSEVSLVFGAWLYGPVASEPHGFQIEKVWLEQSVPGWAVDIAPADGPVVLFAAGDRPARVNGEEGSVQTLVRGSRPGQWADRIWIAKFEPPPSSISFRQPVTESIRIAGGLLHHANALEIVARAIEPPTDKLEVVLLERDSTAWGTVVPLSEKWQRIVVPLGELRFFDHWAHPEGRGGKNDRLKIEELDAVNFCFGSWLYGDRAGQAHGIEIESASLVQGD